MYTFLKKLHAQPVTVAFNVTNDFFAYRNGILDSNDVNLCPLNNNINHAVLATGYVLRARGDSYVMFKNSWGANWGDNGYFKFKINNVRNTPGPCNLVRYSRFTLYPRL